MENDREKAEMEIFTQLYLKNLKVMEIIMLELRTK